MHRVAPARVRPAPLSAPRSRRRPGLPAAPVAHAAVVALALALWGVALAGTDLSNIAGYGLLSALPATYFAALVVLAAGFAAALAGRPLRPPVLVGYVIALAVVLHATTAVLYSEPRYTWTYKHLGVIDYIARHGSVDRTIDVYQNWPGFFALNAWLSRTLGIAPIDYAGWAQLAFELVYAAVAAFALRGLTRDPRVLWTAVWLFLVANWLGQDYLAPQALGFALTLAILGLILRCAPLPWGRPPLTRWLALVRRRPARLSPPVPVQPPDDPPLGPRAALAVGAACYLAIVVSHQLTPVLLLLGVAGLWLVTGRPPLWVLLFMVAVEAWWVALSWSFVASHFNLLQFDLTASARETAPGTHPLPGAALGLDLARVSILLVVMLALAGLASTWRAARRIDVPAVVLAGTPVLVVAVQSYGGEAPLRAYLFALPWLALLAARLLRRPPAVFVASVAVGATALFGYFGQEMLNRVGPASVRVANWYLDHAPPGASLTEIAPSFPDRPNGRYASHLDVPPSLVTRPGYRPHRLGPGDVDALRRLLDRDNAPARYVVLDPVGARYTTFYGLAPPGSFARLARALGRAPDFRLAYHRPHVWLYRYVPAG